MTAVACFRDTTRLHWHRRTVRLRNIALRDYRLFSGPNSNVFWHPEGGQEVKLQPNQTEQLRHYMKVLMEQNKVMNLTAVKSVEEAWDRHVQDSISLLPVLHHCLRHTAGGRRIVDIGSGAGLPGLVIAIVHPECQMVLLDATQKRCKFVESVVRDLGLTNVDVLWTRAETAGRDHRLRESFDTAIARAVAELRTLVEISLPLVKPGGHLVAAKGPNPWEELSLAENAIKKVGGRLLGVAPLASFGPGGQRVAIAIEKIARTPHAYPRMEGLPKKKPL